MNETTAWAATRSKSVRVRATEGGVPTEVRIDPHELRFGGTELAHTILDLHARATAAARAQRRTQLERDGVTEDALDRLGLPRASQIAETENDLMDTEAPPKSWLESL